MPTIAIDARMINSSGIGVYLKQLIPYLLPTYKVIVLGNEEELRSFNWAPKVHITPLSSPIYSIKEQLELYQKVPACDIFWTPQYNIPVLPIKAKKRVVTIHDTYHLTYKHRFSLAQRIYASVVMKAAVRLSHKVITVSEFSAKEIIRHTQCPAGKIKVIYNAVDRAHFQENYSAQEIAVFREAFPNLPEQYLLFVGNVKPHKNLVTLLKAFLRMSPALQDQLHIVIVGQSSGFRTPEKELFTFLEQHPEIKDKVRFTGFVQDHLLPLLYNCASLTVFPSLYEGFGLPPLEAMASGCPVIASNAASIPEVCGDAAMYFNALEAEELRQQLERAITDASLREDLVAKGRRQSLKFSWDASASQHLHVFNELLNPA